MDCGDAKTFLLSDLRGNLPPETHEELRAHLAQCTTCQRAEVGERALTDLLEQRLPQHPASIALKRRLAERWLSSSAPPVRQSFWRRHAGAGAAGGLAVAAALSLFYYADRGKSRAGQEVARLSEEATNDHLRVLGSEHPVEIESGGMHQVKPWFTGKLDFAPAVPFLGDDEFSLQGGAVGYFLDRKAATFVYKRRLHTISLFVFRADGLAFPTQGTEPMGGVAARASVVRGFSVLLWQNGELGYALVSDLNPSELFQLGLKVVRGS